MAASYHTLGVTGSPRWASWAQEFARRSETTVSAIFGVAIQDLARAQGYKIKPPPRLDRTPRRKPAPAGVRVATTR
jgi:hypothetical protein